jgi:hypothetical protein
MPVLLTNEELAIRQGAAWNEYTRNHVAGNKQRQVFTGADKCTDQTESSHVTMSKLVDTAFETWANMRHEDDEQERVHLFAKYFKEDDRFNEETQLLLRKIYQDGRHQTSRWESQAHLEYHQPRRD